MSRVVQYLMVFSGLMLLFYFFGYLQDGVTSTLLKYALSPGDMLNWDLLSNDTKGFTTILAAAATIGVTGIALLTKNDFLLMVPIVAVLLAFALDFMSIFNLLIAENAVIGYMIAGPITIAYFFVVVEWWRGVKT